MVLVVVVVVLVLVLVFAVVVVVVVVHGELGGGERWTARANNIGVAARMVGCVSCPCLLHRNFASLPRCVVTRLARLHMRGYVGVRL